MPLVEDAILDGCQGIGQSAQSDALDVRCVVPDSTIMVVSCSDDAIAYKK